MKVRILNFHIRPLMKRGEWVGRVTARVKCLECGQIFEDFDWPEVMASKVGEEIVEVDCPEFERVHHQG